MTEPQVPEEIVDHYARVQDEAARLGEDAHGTMEAVRTLELLGRFLPDPPAVVIDVGGGPGFYARRLTALGYEVHLIDPVRRHVEQASGPAHDLPAPASAALGDARRLDHPDDSFDAVLLLGPLYHLTGRDDRLAALTEAQRVARPGAPVVAAAISRFASAIDGLDRGLVDDPAFADIVRRDLADGQHRNPVADPRYFTTSYFHHPDGLRAELTAAGLSGVEVYAVEGVSWAAPDLADRMAHPAKREIVLEIVRSTETEPSILGASPHLLGIGRA